MKTRLNACDRWHLQTPARLSSQKSGPDRQGNPRYRITCLECQRVKVMEFRSKLARNRPYGVIRLTWAAPEFSTGETT